MAPAELSELYYLTLLRMLGCTSGSADNAYFFGDEVVFAAGSDGSIYVSNCSIAPAGGLGPQLCKNGGQVVRIS